jgi:type II secretory pathway component GspD/PulD (secretin)
MRAFPACAALALLLGGCISEERAPPDRDWSFSTDQPTVTAFSADPSLTPPERLAPTPAPPAAGDRAAADASADPIDDAAQDAMQQVADDTVEDAEPDQDQDDDGLLSLIRPATADDIELDYLQDLPPSPFHRLGRNVIRGMDGSWSKMYTLKGHSSIGVIRMLTANVQGFPAPDLVDGVPLTEGLSDSGIRWVLHQDFYTDSTFPDGTGELGVLRPLPGGSIGDLLIVTAPPETLLFIDEFLDRMLADLPQVEIEVRVVEVNLDDLLDWDSRVAISDLEDPSQPFDPVTNPPGHFGGGLPILEGGEPTGYGAAFGSFATPPSVTGFLMSLQGVHNGVDVKAILSLLQTIGASELIQSPTITVLNGHRAMINTGRRVPVFEATGVGNNAQITTKYEDTGVKVELIPFIVSEDVIRIDLSVAVSAVTGEVPLELAGTLVFTPVISTRDSGTTVHVHSGQVLAVGGLKARESIETITKVPILGDIPILGWLFKSRSSRMRNTEIVFFITPTIRIPSETLIAPTLP